MRTVVKYDNRKLYDRESSQYISLSELLKLPLDSFRVVTHGKEKDVTKDTLLNSLTSEEVCDETKVKIMKRCIAEIEK
jgi:polyhydroxyalkanoate synthesis regulator protein